MLENILPIWLPFGNILTSAVGLIVVLWLVATGRADKLVGIISLVVFAILLAGALFQANLIGLPLWIIFGTGGRIVAAGLVVTLAVLRKDK